MNTRSILRWISMLLCLALLGSLTTAAFAGAPAPKEPEISDAVWLYGIPVDNEDYYDPTHGGRFSYDAETNTLSILKDCSTDGQLVIYSSRPGLTIYVANDVTVGGSGNHMISLEADTTITGPGKLTVVTESGTEDGLSGIVLNSGAELTLKDCKLDLSGDHGIYAWDGDASLKIENSTVHAKGTASAISNIKGGIWLTDCKITEPVDGFVNDDKIACKDGSVALETLIVPGAPTVLYTVRFDANGHGRDVSAMAGSGQPVERPGDPFEEGWTFLGWYLEKEGVNPYNFAAPVTGDLTLYAKWREEGQEPKPPVPPEDFTDIQSGSWYEASADYIIDKGYMGSTSTDKNTFEPETKVSRAMVASILYRMADGPKEVPYTGAFTDVKEGAWYTPAIEWCAQNGLANGKGDGTFDPDGLVTRQELAVFMYKLAAFQGLSTEGTESLSEYPDVGNVSGWAANYLMWAVSQGLITGKGQGGGAASLLAPLDTAMRCELASILTRFLVPKVVIAE